MNPTTIKILLAYHNRRLPVLHSDILYPVQTGCALASEIYTDMQRDDEGENISAQNPKYCELSALYWGWKNQDKLGNPQYIGLMHDRRHFMFDKQLPIPNKKVTWLPESAVYMFPPICPQYMAHLTDDAIRQYFPAYDCMVLKEYDITPKKENATMKEEFLSSSSDMTPDIFELWQRAVEQSFPSYKAQLDAFVAGHRYYLCNMFVLRKDLFDEFCHFLFTVLQALDQQIDSTGFSVQKMRFLGLVGEFTLSLFIMKLKTRPDIKLIEADGVFFMDPLNPKYKKMPLYKWKSYLWGKVGQKYQKKYEQLAAEQAVLKFFK